MNSNITGILEVGSSLLFEKSVTKDRMLEACKKRKLPLLDVKDAEGSEDIRCEFTLPTTDKIEALNQLKIIVATLREEGFTSRVILSASNSSLGSPVIKNYRLAN